MRTYIKPLIAIIAIFSGLSVNGQNEDVMIESNPPVFMETFVGDDGLAFQMILDKQLQSAPRFGFFSVTDLRPEWGKIQMEDYLVQGKLTYTILRGIDLAAGFSWNPVDGIRPSAAALFTYGNPQWFALFNPRIDLSKNPNLDNLILVEYKPELSSKLSLYSRVQALYVHTFGLDLHARSYVLLRAGVTWKDLSFGPAVNFDWFGPDKVFKSNIGGFIAINLF